MYSEGLLTGQLELSCGATEAGKTAPRSAKPLCVAFVLLESHIGPTLVRMHRR